MANIWEKAISILAGNLNSGLSYLITTVAALIKSTSFAYLGLLSIIIIIHACQSNYLPNPQQSSFVCKNCQPCDVSNTSQS